MWRWRKINGFCSDEDRQHQGQRSTEHVIGHDVSDQRHGNRVTYQARRKAKPKKIREASLQLSIDTVLPSTRVKPSISAIYEVMIVVT
jgi:hypothetical protein